jgi:UDP-N-acetyl-2-amino-2-deoxyglucuronate dehydrogenase
MNMNNWRIAVIGCGSFAKSQYLPKIPSIPHCQTVAVCDILPERAREYARLFNVPEIYTSIDELLKNCEFDVLINATPGPAHHGINMAALKAGKHLFSQKPVGLTVEEVQMQIDAAKASGVKYAANPAHMLKPEFIMAKQLIKDGAIGQITKIYCRSFHGGSEYFQFRDTDPTWFLRKGGGPIYDMGIHAFCEVTGLLGPVKRVGALAVTSEKTRTARSGSFDGMVIEATELPDNYIVYMDFGHDVIGTVDIGFCQKETKMPNLEVYGTLGTISFRPAYSQWPMLDVYIDCPDKRIRGWLNPMDQDVIPNKQFHNSWVINDLIDAIENDRPPVLDPQHALHQVDICCTIDQSVAQDGKILPVHSVF